MNREQLNERHADIVRRYVRELSDRPGHMPPRLLGELADLADEHAVDENRAAVDRALAARITTANPDVTTVAGRTVPAPRKPRRPADR